jgi:hypothetical protein
MFPPHREQQETYGDDPAEEDAGDYPYKSGEPRAHGRSMS